MWIGGLGLKKEKMVLIFQNLKNDAVTQPVFFFFLFYTCWSTFQTENGIF